MSKVLLFLYVVVAVLWAYFLWSRRRFYKVYWQLRGPLGLPFIGLGLQMMKPEKFLQYMQEKGKQYKTPFISWMGTKCFLYVNDPQTVETIMNSACCTNKGDLYRFMANAIGDGLFTSSSPRWNKHRRLINPSFSRQVINTFLPIFNRESDILINKLIRSDGQSLEIYEILKRSVLETACQTTMGTKTNFQNDGSTTIFESYNGITEVCVKRMLSPWLYPDILYRNSLLFKRQQKYINVLYEFVEKLLKVGSKMKTLAKYPSNSSRNETETTTSMTVINQNEYKENRKVYNNHTEQYGMNKTKDNNEEIIQIKSRVFIDLIRNHIAEGQLTWQDVRDEANVIVAATYETTSTALYFVCLCLAMHPEYQDKLYNELLTIFPTNGTRRNDRFGDKKCLYNPDSDRINEETDVHADITVGDLGRMTYADMVISEAMRLFAPVPMVLRQASCDFKLNNGIIIPESTQIGIDIFNMQRSKDVWGPTAGNFNPDKHFAADHNHHPFAYIPFTKGLRMCIGYRYALILMKIMLAKIFLNFRIHTDAKIDDLAVKGTISLKLCRYPLCKLQKRKTYN